MREIFLLFLYRFNFLQLPILPKDDLRPQNVAILFMKVLEHDDDSTVLYCTEHERRMLQ